MITTGLKALTGTLGEKRNPYPFKDVETLLDDFKRDCERILEEVGENESS